MRAFRASTIFALCAGLGAATGCSGGVVDAPVGPGSAGSARGTGGSASAGAAGQADAGAGGSAGRGGGTGTAGGSPITGVGTGNGSSDGGNGGLDPDAACLATAQEGEQRPIALLFMMDNSASMNTRDQGQTATRWELITAAVPDFLVSADNAGLFVGLDFFPEPVPVNPDAGRGGGGNNNNNALCAVTDYENLNVPIDVLPGANDSQVGAFANAILTRTVQGNTPTTPALEGALASAGAWQTAHPDQIVAVVFVTDGQPNGCNPNTVATAAAAAAAAAAATPPIRTYVLGVGPETGNLDAIAVAGGTGPTAYLVTTGGSAALTAALTAIKGSAVSCEYKVPNVSGQQLDYTAVNVQTRVGSTGTSNLVGQVRTLGDCGTDTGWYFDTPIPVLPTDPKPTTITLCPSSCDPLKMTTGSQLQVLLGCKTVSAIR
jgi:Mg-chelatase subunit ChlD